MSTQAAVSGNATKNNGGTIKKAGNADLSGPITSSRTLMQDAVTTAYGAKVALTTGNSNAFTNFAYDMVPGRYIMKKNTSYVNGEANTLLNSCAGDFGIRRPIAWRDATRSLGVNSWNYVTGAITKGATAGDESRFGQHNGTINDDAATPTDAIPGALQYKTGAKLPIQDVYKPRTG